MAKIYGAGPGTTTRGTAEADSMYISGAAGGYGMGGDDTLIGDAADTLLAGGLGNDYAYGGGGADFLDGAEGNDSLRGGAGEDLLWGGIGNDVLDGGAGRDRLRGGDGADTIRAGDRDEVTAGAGDDSVTLRIDEAYEYLPPPGQQLPPGALVDGGAGLDTLTVSIADATVLGMVADRVGISTAPGGGFGIGFASEGWSATVATVRGVERFIADPGGPPASFNGGRAPGEPALAVNITLTDLADQYFGGSDAETIDLLSGDDFALIGTGAGRVTLGDGADTVRLVERLGDVVISGTVLDFDPAQDRLEVAGFAPGELTARTVAGQGTWLEAPGEARVLLAGVYDTSGFDFV